MKAKVRAFIMHVTNPLHVMCRFMDLLVWYDFIWSKVFGEKRISLTRFYQVLRERHRDHKTT